MRKFKLFFACLLMAVLSIGQVWATDSGLSASAGTFILDFYDSDNLTTSSGTGLTNSNYSSFVKVPTGLNATDVVTAESSTGNVRYSMNGGLSLGKGQTQDCKATFTIGANFPVRKITVVGTAYDNGTPLYVAGTEVTLNTKQATYANCSNSTVITPSTYLTSIVVHNNQQKRSTLYTAVCEYGYRAMLTQPSDGSISASPKTANENGAGWNNTLGAVVGLKETQKVTLSATAPDGKEFDHWTVTKTASPYTDVTTSYLSGNELTMPGYDVTVTVTWKNSASCTNGITISKGTPENGTFDLIGEGSACIDGGSASATVSNIEPADGYRFKQITTTAGAISGMNITDIDADAEINVEFEEIPSHKVFFYNGTTLLNAGGTSFQEGAAVIYSGSAPTSCDFGEGASTSFAGWATDTWEGKVAKNAIEPDFYPSTLPVMGDKNVNYYAVFCNSSLVLATSIAANDVVYLATAADGEGVTGANTTTNKDATTSTTSSEWLAFTVEEGSEDDTWKLKNGTNYVKAAAKSFALGTDPNDLTFVESATTGKYWMVYNDGADDYALAHNSSGGNYWRFYKTSNTSNSSYAWFYVFKASEGTNYMTTCCTKRTIALANSGTVAGQGTFSADLSEACAGTTVTVTAVPGTAYNFSTITVYETADPTNIMDAGDIVVVGNEAAFEMPNYAVTVNATFTAKPCTKLNTPSVTVSGKAYPYDAVQLSWTAIDNAEDYEVYIYNNDDSDVENDLAGGVSYPIGTTLAPNTTYKYKVTAISSDAQYCSSNDATGTFTTDALPTYTVNWYINGNIEATQTDAVGTTMTVPNDFSSFTDCSDFHFIGWKEGSAIDGGSSTSAPSLANVGTEIPAANKDYYAVFAEGTPGENVLVTSTSALTNGTKVYLYSTFEASEVTYGAVAKAFASGNNVRSTSGTVTNNKLTPGEDAGLYTIGVTENGYTFNDGTNYLYAASTSQNHLKGRDNIGDDQSAEFSISISNGEASIASVGNTDRGVMQFNKNGDTGDYTKAIFSCYSNADYNGIKLFKHIVPNFSKYYTTCPHVSRVNLTAADVEHGSISFVVGGSAVTNPTTEDDVEVEIVAAPEDGYELTGVALSALSGASYNSTTGKVELAQGTDGDLTVTATFSAIDYAVTMTQTGGANATLTGAKDDAHYGEIINISTTIPNGYLFAGWTPAELFATTEAANATSTSFTMPNNNVTVTANILPKVTVTFYVGATTYGEPAETYQGGKISLPADPTSSFDPTNYPNFIGWSATDFGAATSAPALVDGSETINASTSYYAVFADKNPSEMTNNYSKVTTTGDLANNCKYVIAAWDADESKHYAATGALTSNTYYLDKVDITAKVSENIVSAPANSEVWTAKVANNKVQFQNASTNKYMNCVVSNTYTNFTLTDNSGEQYSYAVSAAGAWTFTTSSLSTNKQIEYYDNSGKDYFSYHTAQDAPIYLYKQLAQVPTKWATKQLDEVTVWYYDNIDNTNPINSAVLESGNNTVDLTVNPGELAGYHFTGWSLTTNGAVIDELTNITENKTLYAIWEANHTTTIKFYAINTTTPIETHDLLQGLAYAIPDMSGSLPTAPTGYTFAGWSASQIADEAASYTKVTSVTPAVAAADNEMPLYAIYKRSVAGTDVTDEITTTQLAATTNQYAEFSNVAISSNARYTGKTSNNNGIQMNVTNPNAIVTTTSGGVLKNISIEWNSNCAADRVLDVYVNNSAYTGSADLWGEAAAQGTKVTTFTNNGSTTSYNFTDDYAYIGVRSHQNALNLDKISITWTPMTYYYTSNPKWTVTYTAGEGSGDDAHVQKAAGENFDVAENTFTAPDGKEFDGWLCNVDAAKYAAGAKYTMTAAATTFTAQWKQITYAVTYVSAHGTAPDAENAAAVTLEELTADGWTHNGWVANVDVEVNNATVDAGTLIVNGTEVVLSAATEFTAQWTENPPVYEIVRSGLVAGRHYTVCLEKKVTAVKGATFWSLTYKNSENTAAYLVQEEVPFAAGKPYIIQATDDNDGKLEVAYEGDAVGAPVENGALRGTFGNMTASDLNAINVAPNVVYMLFNNELRPIGTDNHLDAHRAYVLYNLLTVPSTSNFAPGKKVKSMPLQKDVATGMDELNASEAPVKVMIDGKFYILRGEKMYDATGKLVK